MAGIVEAAVSACALLHRATKDAGRRGLTKVEEERENEECVLVCVCVCLSVCLSFVNTVGSTIEYSLR
jgi:hypothetical protein